MCTAIAEQQLHGYKGGHHLLAGTVRLDRTDQELLDRLSDLSGPLEPGQVFEPYITTFPLPSGIYYVVARTWQDRQAERAGCVLTRSILIPMQDWLSAPIIGSALKALVPFNRDVSAVDSVHLSDAQPNVHAVHEAWTAELVEALFLETRKPTVIFGADDADSVIARLLTALWPGLRRQFTVCSFALAPRRLSGRFFDLLFAPNSSRIRFADWAGRKINAQQPLPSRHRWTAKTAVQIFETDAPGLAELDALGVLKADDKGNESALRVALLWSELIENSKTSPTAALGLMDILRSQKTGLEPRLLLPTLMKSVRLSEEQSRGFDHLRFLMTLLGKFSDTPIPMSLLKQIYHSSRVSSRKGPADALEFLKSADDLGRTLPRVMCGGIASGIASATLEFGGAFASLRAQTRLSILSGASAFAEHILNDTIGDRDPSLLESVCSALEYPEDSLRNKALTYLLPALKAETQAPILVSSLKSAAWPAIKRVVLQLSRGKGLDVPKFDGPIIEAARSSHALHQLRDVVANLPETDGSDRLIVGTFLGEAADIHWLTAKSPFDVERQGVLLNKLLERSDDSAVDRIFGEEKLPELLTRALGQRSNGANQLGRIYNASRISSLVDYKRSVELIPFITDAAVRRRLTFSVAKWVFSYGEATDDLRNKAIEAAVATLDVSDLIAAATDKELSAEDLNRNIVALNCVGHELRTRILGSIDTFSDRVMTFRHSLFDLPATKAWASMIASSGDVNARAQSRAAEVVLPFALRMKFGPASPLVVATFPIVHAELARGASSPNLFSMIFFGDHWDRCDTLRRELVSAFELSEWPPADLIVAATEAGVEAKVADLIVRLAGKKFRKALIKDLSRLPPQTEALARKTLKQAADD